MIQGSESQQAIRDVVKQFVQDEIVPKLHDLEHGDLPPYEVLRKMFAAFGMRDMGQMRAEKAVARAKKKEDAKARGEELPPKEERVVGGDETAMQIIPIIELSRYCPGLVTALGVSVGLTANTIMSRGTSKQIARWAPGLLSLDKIGAWAITEPGSGSDAFGAMKSTATLTNLGRGAVIDEPALVAALEEGRIKGAALDVFATEPLPAASPLWRLRNVLVSPHCADNKTGWLEDSMRFFLENLERFRRGEPLLNVVDKLRGY